MKDSGHNHDDAPENGHSPEDDHAQEDDAGEGKTESQAVAAAGGEDRGATEIGFAPTAMLPLSRMSEEEQQVMKRMRVERGDSRDRLALSISSVTVSSISSALSTSNVFDK